MRNIIRIGAGTDGRNRFVAIALGVALAAGPAVALPAAALAVPATDAAAASTTAGATITLQGADGASLAGHTFDVYRIGTYTDQILNGTRISSLGVRGDTASNAWAADAIGIANAYDPSTADDIGKVYGYDDAGNIANIKMDSQTRQLRNISKALGQSTRKPAAIQGGANLTTTQSTLTINVPSEGLYYITDSAGNPIMVGTKSGNANIMKNDAKDPQWRTLGTAVVKAKSVRVDKKVQVQRNGTTVGKDGTTNDPVGVTVGDTVTNTVEVTVPNKQAASAVKFKLIDQPKGQTYVKGSLSVRLKNAPRTDITADAVIYDGTTQNNAKSIPGDPALKTADNRPADPDLAIPAGGWGIDGRNLLDKYSNRTIVITYRMTVDKASVTDPSSCSSYMTVSSSAILKLDVLGERGGRVVFVFDPPCRVVHPQHLPAQFGERVTVLDARVAGKHVDLAEGAASYRLRPVALGFRAPQFAEPVKPVALPGRDADAGGT